MATAPHADVIRLTLPADPAMAGVLTVAVRVASVRLGLAEHDVDGARSAAAAAFEELAANGAPSPVEVELLVLPTQLRVRLQQGDRERTVRVPSE